VDFHAAVRGPLDGANSPLPGPAAVSTVDFMTQLWSSSSPSRLTPAGVATMPIFGRAYRHDQEVKAVGDG